MRQTMLFGSVSGVTAETAAGAAVVAVSGVEAGSAYAVATKQLTAIANRTVENCMTFRLDNPIQSESGSPALKVSFARDDANLMKRMRTGQNVRQPHTANHYVQRALLIETFSVRSLWSRRCVLIRRPR